MRPPLISGHGTFSKFKEAAELRPICARCHVNYSYVGQRETKMIQETQSLSSASALAHRSSNNDSDVATVTIMDEAKVKKFERQEEEGS